jgi:dTDP-4-amino-4,6-dideoxygalactose transaminase
MGRNELMRRLLHDGIATRRGVMAIHHEAAYAASIVDLPHTDAATRDSLMLPLFPGLTDEQQDYVVDRLATHVTAMAA